MMLLWVFNGFTSVALFMLISSVITSLLPPLAGRNSLISGSVAFERAEDFEVAMLYRGRLLSASSEALNLHLPPMFTRSGCVLSK
ncbi:hypothetical protein JG688_00008293, partial [Phytophthora aleatoria]